MGQSVPKCWHIKFKHWGITQKKTYKIQNMAKIWNQEYFTSVGRKLQDTFDYSKNSASRKPNSSPPLLSSFAAEITTPYILSYSSITTATPELPIEFINILHTYPPMKMEQSVPKRRHIKFRHRGITQKKAYNIQNKAKVWNQELFSLLYL